MINPVAGDEMAKRFACVILGINKPLVVEEISSMDDPAGAAPVIFIATWAFAAVRLAKNNESDKNLKVFIKYGI
jgi:hypothetical protein